jgi:starch phosphorylase
MFIFGLKADEVEQLWLNGYGAANYYISNERLTRIINYLSTGFAGESFADIASYLLNNGHGVADPYMCLADFESYYLTHRAMIDAYRDKEKWNRMSLLNIAAAGKFAADRSIEEYAQRIWKLKKVK